MAIVTFYITKDNFLVRYLTSRRRKTMKKTLIIAVVIATVALLGIRAIVGRNTVSEASVAKASILDMESAAAYNNLGNAYMKDRQHDQAIDAYKKALELDPKFSEAYYNLGNLYAQKKEYDLAVRNYREAIGQRKDFREAYYKLAKVYDRQGKREDAIRTYKELCSSERVSRIYQ
jgi:tetratricopeptide (TPR) repeat protein